MEPGRPMAGASSGATPPKRVFGSFLHEQKVPRRQAKPDPGKPERRFHRFFWRLQKKWFLERTFQGRSS